MNCDWCIIYTMDHCPHIYLGSISTHLPIHQFIHSPKHTLVSSVLFILRSMSNCPSTYSHLSLFLYKSVGIKFHRCLLVQHSNYIHASDSPDRINRVLLSLLGFIDMQKKDTHGNEIRSTNSKASGSIITWLHDRVLGSSVGQ